jgi:hypothetical protein
MSHSASESYCLSYLLPIVGIPPRVPRLCDASASLSEYRRQQAQRPKPRGSGHERPPMNHNILATGWAGALVWDRVAELHREAERDRLAQQVRKGLARSVMSGSTRTSSSWIRGLLDRFIHALRRLRRPHRPKNQTRAMRNSRIGWSRRAVESDTARATSSARDLVEVRSRERLLP